MATDEGRRVQVPRQYLLDGHVVHAYALTVHKSQGMTCDVTLVLGDDTLHAEAGYTAMARGRPRNHLYTGRPSLPRARTPVRLPAGDVLRMLTPGGGGWGPSG